MEMDWPEDNLCIKCDKGGKKLLVCNEDGCPLVVHKKCLGCPVRVDDAGRFYCPYCMYKKAVAETRKARENALAKKNALQSFMDGKAGENKTREDNGHDQSKSSDTNVHTISCDDGKRKSNNDGIIDQPSPHGEEEKVSDAEEDSEASAGSKGRDPSTKSNGENANGIADEEQVQEEERETSAEGHIQEGQHETSPEEEVQEEERETSVEEEQIQEEQRETSVEEEETLEEESETSSASTNQDSPTMHPLTKKGAKKSKPADKDSDAAPRSTLLKHGKRYATRSSPAKRSGKVVNEEFSPPRKLKKPEEPPSRSKEASPTFGSVKRKRLMWTEEEEETIREGVRRHSKEGSSKLPWRTMLEEGRNKFDPTRTPGDLRDKWRNMVGRKRR